MKKTISLIIFSSIISFLFSCASTPRDTYKRTYDVSHPDKTVEHYIEIIQTFSPSLLREVMYFHGRKEREYLISQVHREILPLVTSPHIDRFKEMTSNPVGITVIDSTQVTNDFYLYLIHFNKPNLIYGIQPDNLDFLRVKKYGKNWLIEADFRYREIEKERELTEQDAVLGPMEFELWRLQRRRNELRRMDDSEIILIKHTARAKYEILRRNRDEWEELPNYRQRYNYWRHMNDVYAGMSPSDMKNYLLTEYDRQIESTRNLLRR